MATALMAEEGMVLDNLPPLADIICMCELLDHLGVASSRDGETVTFQPAEKAITDAPYDIVRKMRASVLVLGPLLARYGKARVSLPGDAPLARGRWFAYHGNGKTRGGGDAGRWLCRLSQTWPKRG